MMFLARMACGLLTFLAVPPFLPAQWTSLTGGGAISSVRSMVTVGADLYAVSYPNGVKKSTNGGTVWNPVNTGLPLAGTNVFSQSIGWNGTYLFTGTHSGIYRSDDGGANWYAANGTLVSSGSVYANKWFVNAGVTMAIFSSSVAAGGGIWRTTDHGNNWYIGHSGMGSNAVVYAVTIVGAEIWAATNVGIYTSADNGLNWTAHPVVNYSTFGIAVAGADIVILSTFGYRYSNNGGSIWNDATGDPASPTEGELAIYDGMLYANTGSDLLRSLDDGVTWSSYTTGIGVVDIASLEEFAPAGTRLYVTALFDIYYINGIGLGAPEHPATKELSVLPCPATDGFTVDAPAGSRTLELIDASGRVVLAMPLAMGINTIERGATAAGTYLVRILDAEGIPVAHGRLVVN